MAPTALPLESFTTFGDLLKHLRKRAGLTQRELGQAVNYSESHITRLENGSRLPDPAAIKAHFIEPLHLQREPEAIAWLLHLAEQAQAQGDGKVIEMTVNTRAPTNNLPAPLTHFIGRAHELAEVLRRLDRTRLLTLTGAGGVGKTRLAQQAAWAVLPQYSHGVWLVELASVTDATLVAATTAAAFGLHVAATGLPAKEALIEHLRDKQALVMLDNSEHLIQACAELVSALLRACPHLRVLATSREPLNLQGEVAWRVPSMALEEATQLFEARALAAIPGSALTGQDGVLIAKICQRLDGIPLAIELAASRLRVYSLDMIAARLDDRFRLLTGGERTALPRHQTLWALIDWSYSLLSADEQRLLRYLSVFAGGCTLEAAESVGEGMDVLIVLPQLVNKSLVIVGERAGQRRYTMLETIRQFAAAKLHELNEADGAYERMANYLVKLGQTLGRSAHSWLKLEAEMDNVRAMIVWARAHPDPAVHLRTVLSLGWQFSWDYLAESLAWLAEALERSANVPVKLRLDALLGQVDHLYFSGYHLASWATQAEEYVMLSEQFDDNVTKINALFWAGLVEWHGQNYVRVAELQERALKIAQLIPHYRDGQDISNSLWVLGLVQMKMGDFESASLYFSQCLQTAREGNNGNAMLLGLGGFGWMNAHSALVLGEKELARLRELGQDEPMVRVLQAYTQPLIVLGHYSQAKDALAECLTLWNRFGVRWDASLGSAQVLLDLGQVAWLQGEPLTAREWYEQSLDEYSQVGDRERIARLHIYIGLTRLAQGDADHAAKDFHIGLNLYRKLEQPAGIALALAAHARLAETRGKVDLAARLFGAASVPQDLLAVSILWPASPVIYQREIAEARQRFETTEWHSAWAAGEQMTLAQACDQL